MPMKVRYKPSKMTTDPSAGKQAIVVSVSMRICSKRLCSRRGLRERKIKAKDTLNPKGVKEMSLPNRQPHTRAGEPRA